MPINKGDMKQPEGFPKGIYTRESGDCCSRIVLGMGPHGSVWFGKIIVFSPCQTLRINENVCSP